MNNTEYQIRHLRKRIEDLEEFVIEILNGSIPNNNEITNEIDAFYCEVCDMWCKTEYQTTTEGMDNMCSECARICLE